jgi:hypothetical protein
MAGGCARVLFTVLTLLTIGISAAMLILVLVAFVTMELKSFSQDIFIAIIIAMVVSILILGFGIYASCCGGKGAQTILTLIYLVYALALGALGIAILAMKNPILSQIGDLWDSDDPDISAAVDNIRDQEHCRGWGNETDQSIDCKLKIEDLYKKYGIPAGAVLIVLFLLLLVGVFFAFKSICSKDDEPDLDRSSKVTTPLTYGW